MIFFPLITIVPWYPWDLCPNMLGVNNPRSSHKFSLSLNVQSGLKQQGNGTFPFKTVQYTELIFKYSRNAVMSGFILNVLGQPLTLSAFKSEVKSLGKEVSSLSVLTAVMFKSSLNSSFSWLKSDLVLSQQLWFWWFRTTRLFFAFYCILEVIVCILKLLYYEE